MFDNIQIITLLTNILNSQKELQILMAKNNEILNKIFKSINK